MNIFNAIPAPVPLQQTNPGQQHYWRRAFVLYILAETLYFFVNTIITNSLCSDCVLPVAFTISQWLSHLFFTFILWYTLFCASVLKGIRLVAVNILVFAAYYFLWLAVQYILLYVAGDWLFNVSRHELSFRILVNGSWFEVGKYMLKLAAFYGLLFFWNFSIAEKQRLQMSLMNKDLQLNMLKQQLSPHFYFNTLNNLYGLARTGSAKLPDALHQLNNIMQYVLIDCNQPRVLLQKEIQFLESYIALEKLRYEKDIVISMNVTGTVTGQTISPLLLIQFVENAFKHGMKEKSAENWMKVNLEIRQDELLFSVSNSYSENSTTDGIGIRSVKEILRLQYEGKHHLAVRQEDSCFSVILNLNML